MNLDAASKKKEIKKHTRAAPVMAISLAALFLTGCFVDESLYGAGGSVAEPHKPQAPRELRTLKTAKGTISYALVDGEVILEGDMIMGPVEDFEARQNRGNLSAYSVGRDSGRWDMPVKYSFADSIPSEMRSHIKLALNRLVERAPRTSPSPNAVASARGITSNSTTQAEADAPRMSDGSAGPPSTT